MARDFLRNIPTVGGVALKTALALVKGDVGLGNVDNTSDSTKNAAIAVLTNKTMDPATVYKQGIAQIGATATLTIGGGQVVVLNLGATGQIITLPAASTAANQQLTIFNNSSSIAAVIRPAGSEAIDSITGDRYLLPGATLSLIGTPSGVGWFTVISGRTPGQLLGRYARTGTGTVATGSMVIFDLNDYDPMGLHSTGVNPTRITPKEAGYYRVWGHIQEGVLATSTSSSAKVQVNGANYWSSETNSSAFITTANSSPSSGTSVMFDEVVYCNGTTDYIEINWGNAAGTSVSLANSVVMLAYA